MFWKKKEPCFHEWKVADFRVTCSSMADIENLYDIACIKCYKKRVLDDYEYHKMKSKGFLK